jgi:hypothetical protein
MSLQKHSNTLFRVLQAVSLSIVLTACNSSSSGVATTFPTSSTSTVSGTGSTSSGSPSTSTTTGSMTLQWTAPVARTDGTPLSLSDIAGYHVHYGTSPGNYTNHIDINNGSLQSVTLKGLPVGTYYVAMSTYDVSGLESQYSASIAKQAI